MMYWPGLEGEGTMDTSYDRREREHTRLWAPYLREAAADEEMLTNLLEQEAKNILHAVDAATQRRVFRAVMARMGAV
jgi:hypothetical protein